MPLTTPVDELTVATLPTLLVQVPPALLLNVVVLVAQTIAVPPIVVGSAFTVTTAVAAQPVDNI
jgi:hypothetical protein